MKRMSPRLRIAAVALLATVAAATVAHAALSPSKIVAQLNKERAALGLPSVRESASKSAACRAHDNYMRRNHILDHAEQPGRPGYSKAGDKAARMSVLSGPNASWAKHDPWINAPIHLSQIYNPELKVTGAADSGGYSCMWTFPLGSAGATRKVWTYPGDGASIAHAQHANEGPYLSQTKVGIPASRTTGPYIEVWSVGTRSAPAKHLVRGSLTGPGGAKVAVKVIDSSLLDGFIQPGAGFLLPVRPLKAGATYSATIAVGPSRSHSTLTHSWKFTATAQTLKG
jgi:hypothetical protein